MRLRLGHPRAALIVAPHADDEAIGAYGLVRALRRRGARVSVLVVTDGAASHPNSPSWPRPRLVRERRRETRAVLRQLGVPAGAIRFLDLPDGAMQHLPPRALRPIACAARRVPRLDLLVGPTPDDDHADHRVTCAVLSDTRLPGVRRLAYEVWSPTGGAAGGMTLVVDRHAKALAVRRYRTQTGAITDDPGGFALTPAQLAAFTGPRETFRQMR